MSDDVYLAWTETSYPGDPDPDGDHAFHRAFRRMLEAAGLDPANPFRELVQPGQCVVLKPNWVRDYNPVDERIESLVTHPSLIASVAELAARALEGRGEIVIGDAPVQSCDFARLQEKCGLPALIDRFRDRWPGIALRVEDWRLTLYERSAEGSGGALSGTQRQRADYDERARERFHLADRGRDSFLEDVADFASRFRVTCYKPSLMRNHHGVGKHEYLVTKRIFEADLFINLPKMKTHIKAGLTGALKNLVGINGHKEYLPHHIKGAYFHGGDCYGKADRFRRIYDDLYDYVWERHGEMTPARRKLLDFVMKWVWRMSRITGDPISDAGWSGNDTVWRMTLDLNHILFFSEGSPRNILSIVDGVVAGEAEGPLRPRAKPVGLLMMGRNPAYVDAAMARLMGYNVSRIPTVYHAIYNRRSRFAGPFLEGLEVTSVDRDLTVRRQPLAALPDLKFVKPRHWVRAQTGDHFPDV